MSTWKADTFIHVEIYGMEEGVGFGSIGCDDGTIGRKGAAACRQAQDERLRWARSGLVNPAFT